MADNEGCKFFVAITGFAEFVNLTQHGEFLQFATKCHKFDSISV